MQSGGISACAQVLFSQIAKGVCFLSQKKITQFWEKGIGTTRNFCKISSNETKLRQFLPSMKFVSSISLNGIIHSGA